MRNFDKKNSVLSNSVLNRMLTGKGFNPSLFSCFRNSMILFFVVGVLFSSCDDEPTDTNPSLAEFDRKAMLENIAEREIIPAYTEFNDKVSVLQNAKNTFVESKNLDNLITLQEAFVETYFVWEEVAMFEFGPAMQMALRASMNTYPTDVEQIENNINSQSYNLETADNLSAIGLPALDYLLFAAPSNEVLLAFQNDPNRLNYLNDLLDQIAQKTTFVYEEWTVNDYRVDFVNAAGTDVGSSLGQVVNEMVKHFERHLRDGKIGIPAGVRTLGIPLPEKTEAYYKNDISVQLAEQNLEALRELFQAGLDDYLNALDAQHSGQALSEVILEKFTKAKDLLEQTDEPLSESAKNKNEQVMEAYTALQELVVLLKADLSSAMGILITYQDNDGD